MTTIRVSVPVGGNGEGGVLLQAMASSYGHAMEILGAFLRQHHIGGRSYNYRVKMEVEINVNGD